MPLCSHIQVCLKADISDINNILNKFNKVLSKLSKDMHIEIPSSSCDFNELGFAMIYSCDTDYKVEFKNHDYIVRPLVTGWNELAYPNLKGTAIELSILFNTEELVPDLNTQVVDSTALQLIRNTMINMATEFNNVPIYFTDELMDGNSPVSVLLDEDNIWNFDIAIIPFNYLSVYNKKIRNKPSCIIGEPLNDATLFINFEITTK